MSNMEVEWTGNELGAPRIIVQSTAPIPQQTNLYMFQVTIEHGHCQIGLGADLQSISPTMACLFSTELGILLEPRDFNTNLIQTRCNNGDLITCGVCFGAIRSFMFVGKNASLLHVLPWKSSQDRDVFALLSANAHCKVRFQLQAPFELDWSSVVQQLAHNELSNFINNLPPINATLRNMICDTICMDFFRHHGYVDSLRTCSSTITEEELELVSKRRTLCDQIRNGEITKAIHALELDFPAILRDVDNMVGLNVYLLKFKSILLHDKDDAIALRFARDHLSRYCEDPDTTPQQVKNALLLFAQPNCGYACAMQQDERNQVACELNKLLLQLAGQSPTSLLERILTQFEIGGETKRRTTVGNNRFGVAFAANQVI